MLEEEPNLTLRDVKHILAATARQVDSDVTPATLDSITYHDWTTNDAGFAHHNYYGFGAVDADAAVSAAASYTNFGLGDEQSTADYSNCYKSVGGAYLNELSNLYLRFQDGDGCVNGTVEFVKVRIRAELEGSASYTTGIRLRSPSGTYATLLQPYSWTSDELGVSQYTYFATSAFYGESASGEWRLYFFDHAANGDQIYIYDAGLKFYYR